MATYVHRLYATRLRATAMVATLTFHAMVPPCVVDTDVGDQLARRMITDDWHFHRWCDLGDFPTPDTPPECLKKIQRTLWKQANPPVYSCVVCATPTKRSCQVCREVYTIVGVSVKRSTGNNIKAAVSHPCRSVKCTIPSPFQITNVSGVTMQHCQ